MRGPLLLWLLATIDTACAGYRAAAGRNALIHKTAYYRRAMLQGALYGQLAVGLAGLSLYAVYHYSLNRTGLWQMMNETAWRMLYVYLPYAGVLGLAFLLRLFPSVDLRSITSTLIFGPFTLLRPLVAGAGLAWGLSVASGFKLPIPALLILILMLAGEQVLGRWLKWRGLF